MADNGYKLLVVDVDGTLVGRDGVISDEDREALAGLRRAGVQVSLSTGRVPRACRRIIEQLSLDGFHVFFDGALVSSHDLSREVYVRPLADELVAELVDLCRSRAMDLELYTATDYYVEHESRSTEIRSSFFDLEPEVTDFTDIWERERIIKAELTTFSPVEEAAARELGGKFNRRLRFSWAHSPAYPGIHFINITSPVVSKGVALGALTSHLGLEPEQVVAIGDGVNDISLLSAAGLAVAMERASAEVKAQADYITGDVGQNGVAQAIRKYLL